MADDVIQLGGKYFLAVELSAGMHGLAVVPQANSGVDIGDVDITTLPAGNLGQRAMAASLSVVPANDVTDATYIGDIKFGEELPAGTQMLGTVGFDQTTHGTTNLVSSKGITVSQTPTVTAGAYSANDAVGGLLTFAAAALGTGLGGVVKDVLILDDAGQDAEMELWLFDQTFTAMSDNAAWAPSEADLRNLVCIISTTDGAWFAAGTPSAAMVEANQRYDCTGTSLFGQLVTRGTPTFAATDDVSVKIGLLRD